jgi:hypothetical protein
MIRRLPPVAGLAIVFAAALLAAGCQTVPQAAPLSTSYDAGNNATKTALVTAFSAAGYQIHRDSEFQLVFDKPNTAFAAQMVFGSQFNIVPNSRVTLTIVGSEPTRVNVGLAIVTNPGSGFESVTDFTSNPEAQQQVVPHLEAAKRFLGAAGT